MNSISERAMLVKVTIEQWAANKTDKKITKEVADRHGSKESMGRYKKDLVAKEALADLKRIAGAARAEHYHRTLPWGDDGYRVMGAPLYLDYKSKMAEFEAQWNAAVDKFEADYPNVIDQAKADLNGLFSESDYPGITEIRRKFSFRVSIKPVPEADDFRVSVGNAEAKEIRRQIEEERDAYLAAATKDAWTRLKDVVSKMAEALPQYKDGTGKVGRTFHDTLVTNITDLLAVLPGLNLTGDPAMEAMAALVKAQLCQYTPDELRDSGLARDRTAQRAAEIAAKMDNLLN